jgi:hypothetical protein
MRWYKQLVAQKFDSSQKRNPLGRLRVSDEIEKRVLQMAHDNPTWGYRRIHLAGMTPHPDEAFMMQCARQLTDSFDGFLLDKRYLIHDRDTKFTAAFDPYLCDQGVEPLMLPPQSPNLNAHCERFVRSIKEEALGRMICMGEASLRYTRLNTWRIIMQNAIIKVWVTS